MFDIDKRPLKFADGQGGVIIDPKLYDVDLASIERFRPVFTVGPNTFVRKLSEKRSLISSYKKEKWVDFRSMREWRIYHFNSFILARAQDENDR